MGKKIEHLLKAIQPVASLLLYWEVGSEAQVPFTLLFPNLILILRQMLLGQQVEVSKILLTFPIVQIQAFLCHL